MFKLEDSTHKFMKTNASFFSTRMLLVVLAVTVLGAVGLFVTHAESASTITGTSFRDTNRNGIQDAGEAPIANHYIYFYDGENAYLGNALTDAAGNYQKSGLADGNYTVAYAPISYNELKQDWVPTTTGSVTRPSIPVTLTGTARVNFGWRQIIRSTDANAPLSTYIASNGLDVRSYNDAVTAQEVYARLMTGKLIGKEAPFITIRFDLVQSGYTSSSALQRNGVYEEYHATSNITWIRWLSGEGELFHEYGHAWSRYYAYMVHADPAMTDYQKIRGVYGDSRLNTSYEWSVDEMIAEDYRQLFGSSNAGTDSQLNRSIPLAKDVPGLKEYLSGPFVTSGNDTAPPSAPTSLTGKAVSQSEIDLSWTASTDNVGVNKYLIFRDAVQVGFVNHPSTSFADINLTPGKTYQYYVKAVDAAGNIGAASTTISVTAQAPDTQKPSAPTNLTSPSQTTNSISLSWGPSSDNVGVTAYRVYQIGGSRKNTYANQIGSASTTSFTVSGLTKGTSYSFYVVAVDGAGNESIPSNTLTIKTKR